MDTREESIDFEVYRADLRTDIGTFYTVADLVTDDFWREVRVAWSEWFKGDVSNERAQELLAGIVLAFDDEVDYYIEQDWERQQDNQ